jgi:hypothetical protein
MIGLLIAKIFGVEQHAGRIEHAVRQGAGG